MERLFRVDEAELTILLVGRGMKKYVGFPLDQAERLKENGALGESLFHLVKDELLCANEDGLQLDESLKLCLDDIAQAKFVMFISGKDDTVPERCVYIHPDNGYVTQVMLVSQRGRMYRIGRFLRSELEQLLQDAGFFVESTTTENREESELTDFPKVFGISTDELIKEERIHQFIIIYDCRTADPDKYIMLVSEELNDYIVSESRYERNIFVYEKDRLKEIVFEAVELDGRMEE